MISRPIWLAALALGFVFPARGWELPIDQQRFLSVITDNRTAYRQAPNDMARGAMRAARARAICAAFPETAVKDWIGKIKTLSSAGSKAAGVLAVALGRDVDLTTCTTSLCFDDTHISPDTPLYRTAVVLRVGALVTFSGNFIPAKTDCFREISLSDSGSMTAPEFMFRFSDLAPINQ
jgi:hypothetical protein